MFSSEKRENLELALRAAEGVRSEAGVIDRLSREIGEELARWAVGQWELRRRATEKFERAAEMLFSRAGLEMATHERVAEWHAGLFPDGVEVVDLTCGVGADLVALAGRGPVVGVDLDEEHAFCAAWNLGVSGRDGRVVCGDAIEVLRELKPQYVFIDPARRMGERRFTRHEDFSPSLKELAPLLGDCELAVIKLSPMLEDEFLKEIGGKVWFVSFERECREAVVVLGLSVEEVGVGAVRVETGSILGERSIKKIVEEAGKYVYDSDRAAVRGHCLGGFELAGLGGNRGYLTGDLVVESEWLRGYEIVWQGSWREKPVRAALRELGARVTVVKTRGVKDDPAAVRREMKVFGERELVLMLYRAGLKERALLVEPFVLVTEHGG